MLLSQSLIIVVAYKVFEYTREWGTQKDEMYSSSVINPDEYINNEEGEFDISDREDDSVQEDEPCVQSFAPQDEESQRKTN